MPGGGDLPDTEQNKCDQLQSNVDEPSQPHEALGDVGALNTSQLDINADEHHESNQPGTPEAWDDVGAMSLKLGLLSHQAQALYSDQVQTVGHVEGLINEVGTMGGVLQQIEEKQDIQGKSLFSVESLQSVQQQTLTNLEQAHREDMIWIRHALSRMLSPTTEGTESTSDKAAADLEKGGKTDKASTEAKAKTAKKAKTKEKSAEVVKTAEVADPESIPRKEGEGHCNQQPFPSSTQLARNRGFLLVGFGVMSVLCAATWLLQTGDVLSKAPLQDAIGASQQAAQRSPLVVSSKKHYDSDDEPQKGHMIIDASGFVAEHPDEAWKKHMKELEKAIDAGEAQSANKLYLTMRKFSEEYRIPEDNKQNDTILIKNVPGHGKDIDKLLNHTGYKHVNQKDAHGQSLLHTAVELGRANGAKALLDSGTFTQMNAVTKKGRTALHYAAALGNVEISEILMDHKAFTKANMKDEIGWTALHHASENGHTEVAKVLMKSPGFQRMSAKDTTGRTALHMAARHGYAEIAQGLLTHPNFKAHNVTDVRGGNACHIAALFGHLEVVVALLNDPRFGGINTQDRAGWTLLHHATSSGKVEIVQAIMDSPRFHMTNAVTEAGWTALHHASGSGGLGIVEALLENDKFLDTSVNMKDMLGLTALHVAASHGHPHVIEVIVKSKRFTAVNDQDDQGFTALHTATESEHLEAVEKLLQLRRFTAVAALDKKNKTALDIAEGSNHAAIANAIQPHMTRKRNLV